MEHISHFNKSVRNHGHPHGERRDAGYQSGQQITPGLCGPFIGGPDRPAGTGNPKLYLFSSGYGGVMCEGCHDTGALSDDTLGGPHNMHLVNDRRFWKEGHKDLAKRENGRPGGGMCGDCHGADHRGTVLSRAATDRNFMVEDSLRRVSAGEPVACNLCHSLEKSFGR